MGIHVATCSKSVYYVFLMYDTKGDEELRPLQMLPNDINAHLLRHFWAHAPLGRKVKEAALRTLSAEKAALRLSRLIT